MIESIPFFPSFSWYAALLEVKPETQEDERKRIIRANSILKMSNRDMARTLISGNSGPMMLTVPVEGGSGMLKKGISPYSLSLSNHGNWRDNHLRALEASYGKTPFFIHLMPGIEKVYEESFATLGQLSDAIHRTLIAFISDEGDSILSESLSQFLKAKPEIYEKIRKRGPEIREGINSKLSIIDALMRYGRETLCALINF